MKNKALFLDRDGVICEALPRGEYLVDWSQFKLMDGIYDLIKFIKSKEYKIFVITNQGQIAKRLLTIEKLEEIHNKMQKLLGNTFDHIYYCPHHDNDNCECRKPKPGMVLEAVKEFNVDLSKSFIVGDSDKDINIGTELNLKNIFVKNKFNSHELKKCNPDFIVDNLLEIKSII